jgi:hypothetical protein
VTTTTATPVKTGKDPRTLVSAEVFDKIARYFAAKQEITLAYAVRATGSS